MASLKAMFFFFFVAFAVICVASSQERVKKQVILNPYAGVHPYAAYPYAAAVHSGVQYAVPYGDDGSYFPGKYDPYY